MVDTLTCPVCGHTGTLDDFDRGGFPGGVVICERRIGRKKRPCWTLIEVSTGKEFTGNVDADES